MRSWQRAKAECSLDRRPPIFKLSDEILALIFLYASNSTRNEKWDYNPGLKKPLTEVKITHVCSKFRSVALQDPRIWTYISDVGRPEPILDRLRTYLKRSRTLPIMLCLTSDGDITNASSDEEGMDEDEGMQDGESAEEESGGSKMEEDGNESRRKCSDGEGDEYTMEEDDESKYNQDNTQALWLAVDHLERWKIANIRVIQALDVGMDLQQRMAHREAPYLEYLHLEYGALFKENVSMLPSLVTEYGDVRPKILQLGCPRLTHLNITIASSIVFLPPLSSITTLFLHPFTFDLFDKKIPWNTFLFLATTLPLRALSIADDCVAPPSAWWSFNQQITVNTLEHLRWDQKYTRDESEISITSALVPFLSNLNAPVLRTLELHHVRVPRLPLEALPNIKMSLPLLHSLVLLDPEHVGRNQWISSFAHASPNLKNIITTSHFYDLDTSLARYLTDYSLELQQGETPLWTQLERFVDISDLPAGISTYNFILSRQTDFYSQFTLRVSRETLEDWERRRSIQLQALKSNGCTVSLATEGDYPNNKDQWPPGVESPLPQSMYIPPTAFLVEKVF